MKKKHIVDTDEQGKRGSYETFAHSCIVTAEWLSFIATL